jgi:regulation of enolase protein 1 (concanavalin A-like superfamily)
LLKLTRQGGTLLIGLLLASLAGAHSAAAQTSALPSGWTNRDVGNSADAGSTTSSGGTITVQGAGADIGGTADQFQFVYRAASGDVDIRVRVDDVLNAASGAKVGLMIRESMNAGSKNAFVCLSGDQSVAFQSRSRDGHKTSYVNGTAVSAPVWIRLVRQGSTVRTYSSPTGATWTQVGSANFRMNANSYIGLAVTSHNPPLLATAVFSSLAVGAASPTPSPWKATDIGSPTMGGSADESSGTFTVTGGGADIWNTSDQFQFVYQPVTGDVQIVARVASLQAANTLSKAGVMIREALTASARHESMFETPGTWKAQCRLLAGDVSYEFPGSAGAPPGWVRVVREGDQFTSYESTDGHTWILVDTETIPMPATVYVGLAVTSHTSTALATATFTNVSVGAPASNELLSVSITAPAAGANYSAPANITTSATASDADGSVTGVDFYAGSTLAGSDTASPFSVTWSNVVAGTYSLSAVATDDRGATTTSAPIAVTGAVPAPPVATKVVFVPPTDYATNVTSLTVELRRAGDAVTATPVATRDLGMPAIVNGEISVDISTLVDPLPAGSYYAIIMSTSPGGSTPSSPSAAFSK